MGAKGNSKVANRFFESKEINRIAQIAPNAKINIIRDYQVTEKRIITLPDHFKGIVKCVNPKCITNNEVMEPRYNVISKSPLVLKCPYCEREIREEELQLL